MAFLICSASMVGSSFDHHEPFPQALKLIDKASTDIDLKQKVAEKVLFISSRNVSHIRGKRHGQYTMHMTKLMNYYVYASLGTVNMFLAYNSSKNKVIGFDDGK